MDQFSEFHTGFGGAPTHGDIIEFLKFLLQLKNQRSGSKTLCGFSIILILKGIYDVLKSESMHFAEQKYKL